MKGSERVISKKSNMLTEVIYSKDGTQRFLLRKNWDEKKRKAMVLMINPGSANEIVSDFTTLYVINNLYNLGYGSVEICNIFSLINMTKEDKKQYITDKENDNQIKQAAERVDDIIIAWGKNGNTNKNIKQRQCEVLELLNDFKQKVCVIGDKNGNTEFHPLAPQIRFQWILKKYDISSYLALVKEEEKGVEMPVKKAVKQKKVSNKNKTA